MEDEISLDNSNKILQSKNNLATDVMTVKEFVKFYKSTRKKNLKKFMMIKKILTVISKKY